MSKTHHFVVAYNSTTGQWSTDEEASFDGGVIWDDVAEVWSQVDETTFDDDSMAYRMLLDAIRPLLGATIDNRVE